MRVKHGVCRRERSPSRLDVFVKSLEEERDFYRQEAERYKRGCGFGDQDLSLHGRPPRGRSPRTKAPTASDGTSWALKVSYIFSEIPCREFQPCLSFQGGLPEEEELLQVVKERDELKDALLDIERQMEDIQDNVKTLSAEKDKFKSLFRQVRLQSSVCHLCFWTVSMAEMFPLHRRLKRSSSWLTA